MTIHTFSRVVHIEISEAALITGAAVALLVLVSGLVAMYHIGRGEGRARAPGEWQEERRRMMRQLNELSTQNAQLDQLLEDRDAVHARTMGAVRAFDVEIDELARNLRVGAARIVDASETPRRRERRRAC